MKLLGFLLFVGAIANADTQCVLTEIDTKMKPASLETPLQPYESPETGKQLRVIGSRFKNITAIVYKTKSGLTTISVEANSNKQLGTFELIGLAQGREEVMFQSWRERHYTGEHIIVKCKETL